MKILFALFVLGWMDWAPKNWNAADEKAALYALRGEEKSEMSTMIERTMGLVALCVAMVLVGVGCASPAFVPLDPNDPFFCADTPDCKKGRICHNNVCVAPGEAGGGTEVGVTDGGESSSEATGEEPAVDGGEVSLPEKQPETSPEKTQPEAKKEAMPEKPADRQPPRECPTDGQTRPCYSGPANTKSVGLCIGGLQTCAQGQWGACKGETTPQAEICDGKDNDCDGQVDEICPQKLSLAVAGIDKLYATRFDSNGNFYVAGWFSPNNATLAGQSLTKSGPTVGNDIFVAKLDRSGKLLWLRHITATGSQYINGLRLFGGGVIVSGALQGAHPVAFGSTVLTANPKGGYDAFVATISSAGVWTSAKIVGTSEGWLTGWRVEVVGVSIYVTGQSDAGVVSFGSLKRTFAMRAWWLLKLNSSLKEQWVVQPQGVPARGASLELTADSKTVYVAADYNRALFLEAYDVNGKRLWAHSGSPLGSIVKGIAADGKGAVYLTSTVPVPNSSDIETRVHRFYGQGLLDWAVKLAPLAGSYVKSVAIDVDSSGRIYVAGSFRGTVDFNGQQVSSGSTTAGSYYNPFVVRLDGNGKVILLTAPKLQANWASLHIRWTGHGTDAILLQENAIKVDTY